MGSVFTVYRILFLARYRDASQHRKVALLAQQPDLRLWYCYPRSWHDDLLTVEQAAPVVAAAASRALPMLGQVSDPHRATYRTLAFGIRQAQPHIIHAEEEPDSLAALHIALARRLCAPRARLLLATWQNLNRPKRPPVRWVLRHTLQASDAVLCASSEAVAVLRQQGYTRPAPVLPPIGVDTRLFQVRPREPDPARAFVVGYVGRLRAEKGMDVLIAALARLLRQQEPPDPPPRLLLIGSGPAQATLEALAHAAGCAHAVEFCPALPPAQVAQQMAARLHALVLPSRATPVWKEQFGRVLVEAMACGVPVVGSSSGAIPEVIGGAGLTFAEDDAAALAACLQRLRQSPTLRATLAQRGRARVLQHYTQEHIAARTAACYRQLMQTGTL
jgi:glycosyltransferase involved in cell wall biosynthesis